MCERQGDDGSGCHEFGWQAWVGQRERLLCLEVRVDRLDAIPTAEGKPHDIRASIIYPGGMATDWGKWSAAERAGASQEPQPPTKALPPDEVAALILWMVTAPAELVLNEAVVSPLEEAGWP